MKTVNDIDIFTLSSIQDREAILYHHVEDNNTYVYIGSERYQIPEGAMALAKHGNDLPLTEKFVGFRFNEDVRLQGQIAVFQYDAKYMVIFATPRFTYQGAGYEAVNDVILLRVGDALEDVKDLK